MISSADFQSYAGPGDRNLARSEVSGYQPVSRIGEIVLNSFVDAYEFATLPNQLTGADILGTTDADTDPREFKPHFHEWATVQPGMVLVSRKKKTAVFRQYVAAETAVPVIACAACLKKEQEARTRPPRALHAPRRNPPLTRAPCFRKARLLFRRHRPLAIGAHAGRRHRPLG
tara:strand:+ start:2155 stop:2673 length:519 start_codon:yes stop_codon:yes gene_type:complete